MDHSSSPKFTVAFLKMSILIYSDVKMVRNTLLGFFEPICHKFFSTSPDQTCDSTRGLSKPNYIYGLPNLVSSFWQMRTSIILKKICVTSCSSYLERISFHERISYPLVHLFCSACGVFFFSLKSCKNLLLQFSLPYKFKSVLNFASFLASSCSKSHGPFTQPVKKHNTLPRYVVYL